MSTSTAGMHDTLWDAFMVKAVDLLPSNLVLKKHRTVVTAIGDLEPDKMKDQHHLLKASTHAHQLSVSDTLTP